ncbi:MAG: hypothetical protein GW917_01510 [Bdellovibrionales bacterium]|nr:hypothetical protein [Bdellovibrionales bacterium]
MDDSIIRSCVLFFLVTLDDESRVYSCCEAALTAARKLQHRQSQTRLNPLVVKEATQIYREAHRKTFGARRPLLVSNGPSEELLKEIHSLRDKVSQDQFISFVWSEIAKVNQEDLSEGLGLSHGTIQYRSHQVLRLWAEG